MNRRVARVGTPPMETRMQLADFQNLWFWSRWNIPPVSIASTKEAFVSKESCSTELGIE